MFIKDINNYVCPKCFYKLNECKCEFAPWELIMIDDKIQYIIRILNKKGYLTTSSCESHYNENGIMYIGFASNYNLPLPDTFKRLNKTDYSIGYTFKKKEYENENIYNKVKEEKLKILKEWCESL